MREVTLAVLPLLLVGGREGGGGSGDADGFEEDVGTEDEADGKYTILLGPLPSLCMRSVVASERTRLAAA